MEKIFLLMFIVGMLSGCGRDRTCGENGNIYVRCKESDNCKCMTLDEFEEQKRVEDKLNK